MKPFLYKFKNGLFLAISVLSSFTTSAQADLAVSVRSNSNTFANWTNITFFVTIKNLGTATAQGVVCNFPLPTNSAFSCARTSVGTWRAWEATGGWDIGSVAAGDSVTLLTTVFALGGSSITATPSVLSTSSDPNTQNNSATKTATLGTAAPYLSCDGPVNTDKVDVELSASTSNLEVNVGNNESFVVNIRNKSTINATGVKVKINIPQGTTYQVHDVAGLGSFNPTTGVWDIPSLPAGTNHAMTLNVVVNKGGALKLFGQVTNCNETDSDSSPNNYGTSAAEDDEADLIFTGMQVDLSMTAAFAAGTPSQIRLGDTITFVANLTNSGATRGDNTKVRAYIPLGFSYVSSTATIGEYDPSVGVWLLSHNPDPTGNKPGFTIDTNKTHTLRLTVKATQTGTAIFDTEVRSCNMPDFDSTPSNNVVTEDDEAQASITVSNVIDPNAADLELNQTVSKIPVNAGDSLIFTVGIFNRGPANATGVSIATAIPSNLSLAATPSVGTYSNGTWTLGSLAANATATLQFKGTVGCLTSATKIFAQVQAANQNDYDSPHGNDTNQIADEDDETAIALSATNCNAALADLELSSSVLKTPVIDGDSVVFQLNLVNKGGSAATTVTVKDSLPSALNITQITPSVGSYNSASKTWTVGNLAVNQTVSLLVRGKVGALRQPVSSFAQVMTASPGDPDAQAGNDTDNTANEDDENLVVISPTAAPNADLELSMTADKSVAANGTAVAFTLTLFNRGNSTADNVSVKDVLPSGLTFVSASAANGSFSNTTGLWAVGSLAANQTATLTLNTTVSNIVSTLRNFAQVQTSSLPDPDAQAGNDTDNTANEDDEAAVTINSASATQCDLELALSAPPQYQTALPIYQTVTFTLKVWNRGLAAANGVSVKYTIPQGMAYNNNTTTKGTYDSWLGTWQIGNIAAGDSAVLQLTLFTLQTTTVQFAQIQTCTTPDVDSTPGNDTNQTANEDDEALLSIPSVSPVKLADLELTMTADKTLVKDGDLVSFSLKIANRGDTTATGVVIKNNLPAGLSLKSATAAQGSYASATGTWTVGSIAPGSSYTLVLTDSVTTLTGSVVRFAQVTAASPADADSQPNNNATTTPKEDDEAAVELLKQGSGTACDLELTMTAAPTFSIYQNHDFTLTLRNTGGVAANGIKVDFPFPKSFVYGGVVTSTNGTVYDTWLKVWNVPTLGPGQSVTMTLTLFNLSDTSAVKAFAQVKEASPLDADSSPGNNTTNVPNEDDETAFTVTPARLATEPNNGLKRFIKTQHVAFAVEKIYPNPTSDGFIGVEMISKTAQNVQFSFFDGMGKLIKSETRAVATGANDVWFDLSALPQGVYFLQVSGNELRQAPVKIVKM